MDIFGLSALDRLFCFMIVRELQYFIRYLQRSLLLSQSFLKQLRAFTSALGDSDRLISEGVGGGGGGGVCGPFTPQWKVL